MAFNRPTLAQIIARVESDMEGIGVESPVLSRAVAFIVSKAIAGVSHLLHGHAQYNSEQIFPDRSDEENLTRQAGLYNVRQNPAEFASGPIVITGTDTSPIPIGAVFSRPDGLEYVVQDNYTIGSTVPGEVQAQVECASAGSAGNLDSGETLQIQSPLPGVDDEATVDTDALTGGTEEETLEEYRARFIEVIGDESLGGSDDDYENWAKEVPGVTRVWVNRHENGLGTVAVRFVRDNDPSIIPDAGEVAEVQEHLDGERPTTAEVTVSPPVNAAQNYTISLFTDTAAARAAVEAELVDLVFRVAEPGDGSGGGTIALTEMTTAIGVVAPKYTLVSPTSDFVPSLGELATHGTITWV